MAILKMMAKETCFGRGTCRRHIIGKGRIRIMKSVIASTIPTTRNPASMLAQCPPGIVLFQLYAMGTQNAQVTVKARMAHPKMTAITQYVTILDS